MRRPDVFTLDYSHPLAQGLVFAGLCLNPAANIFTSSDINNAVVRPENGGSLTYADAIKRSAVDVARSPGQIFWSSKKAVNTSAFYGTLSAWFFQKTTSSETRNILGFSRNTSYERGIALAIAGGVDGSLRGYSNNGSVVYIATSGGPVQVGEWVHGSVVFDSLSAGLRAVYVNGVQVGSALTLSTASDGNNSTSVCVGGTYISGVRSNLFDGLIADPIIHNRALSPAEIALLADRTDPMLGGLVREVNPVSYFDFGASAPPDITGTLSVTESGTDSFAATGQLLISGLMSVTESGSDTISVSGQVLIQGTLSATETGSDVFAAYGGSISPITGTMAVTETGHDTATIIGQLLISGLMDVSEVGDDVFAAIGSALHAITGDMAVSEAGSDIFAALGVVTDTEPITAAEVARIVRATPRMKTVTASARVKQVRYEIARA